MTGAWSAAERRRWWVALLLVALAVLLDLHSLWVIRHREQTINEILAERAAGPVPTGEGPGDR